MADPVEDELVTSLARPGGNLTGTTFLGPELIPNLARPTGVRNRNRITQLRAIEGHESFAMIAHDSPSLLEAMPDQSG